LFDKKYSSTESIGIIEHPRHPINISGFDKINNQSNIETIVNFLSSKSKIVSSTFHGVYWSQLLNKEVLYFKTTDTVNSKIINLKHRIPICDLSNFSEKINNVSSTKGMLSESRKLNDDFYSKTIKIFQEYLQS
jgi:exopolysaccharide biosynthesis predicted pyruvyltransferase EpsI